jgi:hypothetical protein
MRNQLQFQNQNQNRNQNRNRNRNQLLNNLLSQEILSDSKEGYDSIEVDRKKTKTIRRTITFAAQITYAHRSDDEYDLKSQS